MLNTEFAAIQNDGSRMFEIAQKTEYRLPLTSEEKEVSEVCDAWIREIAEKGDPNKEIAAFVKRTVQEEIYNAPDELLDSIFDRGSVGEFDDYEVDKTPKNTLVSYEAAKGGTVDRSWIDFSALKPTTKNRQVETDLSYVDIRKKGFKSIATLTNYAVEELRNAQFYDVLGAVDAAITGGEQVINESTAAPTQTSMDKLSLYLNDRASNGIAVTLSKYAQAIGRMTGYEKYMSDAMKDDFNRYGLIKFFDGIRIASISAAKKRGNGGLLLPDKRVFGIAGKIGVLDQKGEIHVYEDMDNSNELVVIRVKDFTYSYAITNIDNVSKIVMAQ